MKIMFAGDFVQSVEIDKALVSTELEKRIADCDFRCCNFEGPCKTETMIPIKKIGPNIYQNENAINRLKSASFNIVSLANNHIMDYGVPALQETVNRLKESDIAMVGAGLSLEDAYSPLVLHDNDFSLAIVAVSENGFGALSRDSGCGYAWFGHQKAKELIDKCIKQYDRTIIICHGGAEKWNFPLIEYRNLYKSWIDQGVDAVIAHHPHVPQGWEKYNSGFIVYSLGNFLFNKGIGYQNPETIICTLEVSKDQLDIEVLPVVCNDGTITINNDRDFAKHIDECCKLLKSAEYVAVAEKKYSEVFEKHYKGYYTAVSNTYYGSVKKLLKTWYFRFFCRQKFSDLWLFHNLTIETHYWISRRAEEILYYERDNK